ncbi:hypothetical protein GQ53DRAFT_105124 [Thozetella sp. PMI_491]|nr:hypothetical protein GQ53DRAFT_105124 [Thozetella sp. PMI_491]
MCCSIGGPPPLRSSYGVGRVRILRSAIARTYIPYSTDRLRLARHRTWPRCRQSRHVCIHSLWPPSPAVSPRFHLQLFPRHKQLICVRSTRELERPVPSRHDAHQTPQGCPSDRLLAQHNGTAPRPRRRLARIFYSYPWLYLPARPGPRH